MKTYVPKKDEVERQWWLIDADGRKPQYVDFMDTGDFVVVVNAEKIKVTGKKLDQKKYYSHTGYPGGIKEKTLRELMDKKPEEVIRKAVWGMLPKNKLNRAIHKKLKVYAGPDHPHEAQQLQEYKF
jgi:large subunit ribosomal protein L13